MGRRVPKVSGSPGALTRIRAGRAPVLAQRPPPSLLASVHAVGVPRLPPLVLLRVPRVPGRMAAPSVRPGRLAVPSGASCTVTVARAVAAGVGAARAVPDPTAHTVSGCRGAGRPCISQRLGRSLASRAWREQGSPDRPAMASPRAPGSDGVTSAFATDWGQSS